MTPVHQMVDRHPFNSPWVWAWIARWVLPLWFALFSVAHAMNLFLAPGAFGLDVRVYHLAAQAWIAGGDPWAVSVWTGLEHPEIRFAGPPPTLIPFVLLSWIPVEYVTLVFVLGSTAIALWVLRRLKLPVYWLLFPPIFEAIWVGNMNIAVIALLLFGGVVASTVATLLKGYALVPLLIRGRYVAAAVAAAVTILTVPILPWSQFLDDYGSITATLAEQSWGGRTSFLTSPIAWAMGAIALVLLGRERAAWLAVPLLWPSTQLHYSVLALPVFATIPFLALAGTVAEPGVLRAGVVVFAFWERRADIAEVRLRVMQRVQGLAATTSRMDEPDRAGEAEPS